MVLTGTSVVGCKFAGGVIIAADTQLAYGSWAIHKDIPRVRKITEGTIIGFGGSLGDYQELERQIKSEVLADWREDPETRKFGANECATLVSRVMYHQRSRLEPFFNNVVIAGVTRRGEPLLQAVNSIGTTLQEDYCATGMGNYMALPLLRKEWKPDMTAAQAKDLLTRVLQMLWARDKTSHKVVTFGAVLVDGSLEVTPPEEIDTFWDCGKWRDVKQHPVDPLTGW